MSITGLRIYESTQIKGAGHGVEVISPRYAGVISYIVSGIMDACISGLCL